MNRLDYATWATRCRPCPLCQHLLPPGAALCPACGAEPRGVATDLAPSGRTPFDCTLYRRIDLCASEGASADDIARLTRDAVDILDALCELAEEPSGRNVAWAMAWAFEAFSDALARLTEGDEDGARADAWRGACILHQALSSAQKQEEVAA